MIAPGGTPEVDGCVIDTSRRGPLRWQTGSACAAGVQRDGGATSGAGPVAGHGLARPARCLRTGYQEAEFRDAGPDARMAAVGTDCGVHGRASLTPWAAMMVSMGAAACSFDPCGALNSAWWIRARVPS